MLNKDVMCADSQFWVDFAWQKTHASVTMLMEGVTRDGVKYASSQAVGLFDYVQLIHNMLDANLHLENLGGLDSEDDASDSKSPHGSK